MIAPTHISIDIVRRGVTPRIDAMQDDKYCRDIVLYLTFDGIDLDPPAGTAVQVMYSKPDGTGGIYDKMPDGSAAYTIEGSSIRVKLAPQVCTAPGLVKLSVALIEGESVLHTFAIHIHVHPTPGINVKSDNYVNVDTGSGVTQEILDQIRANTDAIAAITGQGGIVGISVTEGADGTVTMVNTFENDATETITIIPDANGNPDTVVYNGKYIPVTWTEAGAK